MAGISTAVSRRRVFQMAGAAAVLTGGAARAATTDAPTEAPTRPLPLSRDQALHAARRLTYGPTPELVAHIRQVGVTAFLEEQLDYANVPDTAVALVAETFGAQRLPGALNFFEANGDRVIQDFQGMTVFRQVWSQRQLYEVMVAFWANHFNILAEHRLAHRFRPADDRDVARAHALGKFSDMLLASAKSPAMLTYLDNWLSDATNINENYGREILELHSVGVHGGYTEDDVRGAAMAFTGWSVDTNLGQFSYKPEMHYVGPIKVMGCRHANATAEDGVEVASSLITYLAHHPATARFIAGKLCRRFVSDTPPASLVASAAKVYLQNGTAIAPVVRHIVDSSAFRNSVGMKYRRPHEMFAAAIRALALDYAPQIGLEAAQSLVATLTVMGEEPFGHGPPDGYSDVMDDWLGTAGTLSRWNAVQALVQNKISATRNLDVNVLVGTPLPTTVGALVDRLTNRLLQQPVSAEHRAAFVRFLGHQQKASVDQNYINQATPQLAALILSSAYLQVR